MVASPELEPRADGETPSSPFSDASPGSLATLDRLVLRNEVGAALFGAETTPVRIDRFRVLARLGAGGMGVVYSALDEELGRKVALKLLRQREVDEAQRSRILREARVMARLSHPNVVVLHDVDVHEGRLVIVMEHIEGETLRSWLGHRQRSWREIIATMRAAGAGLAAAHAIGIVHRDFKPENVMIGDDGRVRVLDFGLAADRGHVGVVPTEGGIDGRITRTGAILGTPGYMAPEQIRDGRSDERSDQYAFCVSLHEAVFGSRPGKPTPAPMRVPPRLQRLLHRGLAELPAARFADMDAVLHELDAILRPPRVRGIAITAALALAGVAVGAALGPAADPSRCSAAAAGLQGVWDDERKQAIRTAFAAASPSGAVAYERIAPRLDGHAEDWIGAAEQVCADADVQRSGTRALDLRQACLERRRSELEGLLALLAVADRDVVDQAPVAVDALLPIASCTDTVALLSAPSEPEHAVQAAAARALRVELDHARAYANAAQIREGLAVVGPLVERAGSLAYRPALAEALLLHGDLLAQAGDREAAQRTLVRAIWTADASGHDEVLHAALIRWIEVSYTAEPVAVLRTMADRASAATERMGSSPSARADLHYALGLIALMEGNIEVMEHEQVRAAELYVDEGRQVAAAKALREVGLAISIRGRPGRGRAYFRRAVELLRVALGNDHPRLSVVLDDLAASFQRTDPPAAFEAALEAVKIRHARLGSGHPELAWPLIDLANAAVALGEPELASRAAELANDGWTSLDGPYHPNLEHVIGTRARVEAHRGRLDRAAANIGLLISLRGTARAHYEAGLGEMFVDGGRVREGIALLERALPEQERVTPGIAPAVTRLALARGLRAAGLDPARADQLEREARVALAAAEDES